MGGWEGEGREGELAIGNGVDVCQFHQLHPYDAPRANRRLRVACAYIKMVKVLQMSSFIQKRNDGVTISIRDFSGVVDGL